MQRLKPAHHGIAPKPRRATERSHRRETLQQHPDGDPRQQPSRLRADTVVDPLSKCQVTGAAPADVEFVGALEHLPRSRSDVKRFRQ